MNTISRPHHHPALHSLYVSCSVGGASSPLHRLPPDVFIKLLDAAVPRKPCELLLELPAQLQDSSSSSSDDDSTSDSSSDDDSSDDDSSDSSTSEEGDSSESDSDSD